METPQTRRRNRAGGIDPLPPVRLPLGCRDSEDPYPETEERCDKEGPDSHGHRPVQRLDGLRKGAGRKPVRQAEAA